MTSARPTVPWSTTTARAHGRVNLMGEHTDYNGGLVLPMLIPQQTVVRLTPRDDREVHVSSRDFAPAAPYVLGAEQRASAWYDFVQGVTCALARRGLTMRGFDAAFSSDVPPGAGLASSAALEVALLRALRSAFGLELDDRALARAAQSAETDFVGAPVGIMDQLVASLGEPDSALLIDTRDLRTRTVPIPADLTVVVLASGFTHQHGSGDYRTRRAECERAASLLGVNLLGEIDLPDLTRTDTLPPPLAARARHVITENRRVVETVAALARNDHAALGALFAASHASQRDDFQVSIPPIDRLVELASDEPGVLGARLTGGGFGGSVVLLAESTRAAEVARNVADRYARAVGRSARILLPAETGHGEP